MKLSDFAQTDFTLLVTRLVFPGQKWIGLQIMDYKTIIMLSYHQIIAFLHT